MAAADGAALAGLLARLDAELAEELRREEQIPAAAESSASFQEIGRHLCFSVGGRHLAIPLPFVLEVGELEAVRPLPFLPGWADGVANIRGEIVSVTNLAAFFRLAASKSRTFIIIHDRGMKTAIVVDKITGTRLLRRREGMPFKGGGAAIPAEFLSGPAWYAAEDGEQQLELFDGRRLLAAIRMQ